VENLLNMSRLETGMLKIKRDCVIAMKLFMLQFKKIAPIKKQSHYRFYTKWLPLFKLDAGLIEEIIQNLITNYATVHQKLNYKDWSYTSKWQLCFQFPTVEMVSLKRNTICFW
jgi:K+-sensing histidine kinase KdpD